MDSGMRAVLTKNAVIGAAEGAGNKTFSKNAGAFPCSKIQEVVNSLCAGQFAFSAANVFSKVAGTVANLNGT